MTTYNSNVSSNYLVMDALLPKEPTKVNVFRSRMHTVIQEKKCISLVSRSNKEKKRYLQWVIEEIDILYKLVSKVLYRFDLVSIT